MKKIASILILFSLFLGNALAQDFMQFGGGGQGFGGQGDGGYGNEGGQQQGQQPHGGTGLERKNLNDQMKVIEPTELSESDKCKTTCNMGFSTCYRLETDRGKCYKDQQECLGKCGGEQEAGFGEDPGGYGGFGGQGGGGEYGF